MSRGVLDKWPLSGRGVWLDDITEDSHGILGIPQATMAPAVTMERQLGDSPTSTRGVQAGGCRRPL